ncbi:MerR family transcriptional regulator [Pseudomonas oryzihabitans]|nr:MerR family transcriptional regulator [Pseudomonas psychrotolerans]
MTAASPSLSIGQLATATGVSVRSLRHYEAQGLLVAGRGANGYRHFPASAVAQVRQLQRLLGAGFSLAEIRSFPDCMRLIEGAQACPETSAAQRERLQTLERQIEELESRRARLLAMLRDSEASRA